MRRAPGATDAARRRGEQILRSGCPPAARACPTRRPGPSDGAQLAGGERAEHAERLSIRPTGRALGRRLDAWRSLQIRMRRRATVRARPGRRAHGTGAYFARGWRGRVASKHASTSAFLLLWPVGMALRVGWVWLCIAAVLAARAQCSVYVSFIACKAKLRAVVSYGSCEHYCYCRCPG